MTTNKNLAIFVGAAGIAAGWAITVLAHLPAGRPLALVSAFGLAMTLFAWRGPDA